MSGSHCLVEDKLTFTFSNNYKVAKYDDWSFYRNQFQSSFGGGIKAVDFICIDNEKDIVWFIEVKDYREHSRTKLLDLGEEVALKVKDTLVGLTAAQCNANDQVEKNFSSDVLNCKKIRIALHLELPAHASRLSPKDINIVNVQLKLQQWARAVDAHPVVVDKDSLKQEMNWTVTSR